MKKFWRGSLDLNKHVSIIGGGISGLLVSYHLKKNKIPFTLYESSSRVGGKISSLNKHDCFIESAANAIVLSPKVKELCEELNLKTVESEKKLKRSILRDSKITDFPFAQKKEVFKILLNLLRKTPKVDSSLLISDFWSPLLGKEFTQDILLTALQGIYGSSTKELSFQNVFSQNFSFGKKTYFQYIKILIHSSKGLKSATFENGMQELPKALAHYVKDETRLNLNLEELPDNSIICTPPQQAYELSKEDFLAKVKLTEIYSHTIILHKALAPLNDRFGLLCQKNKQGILGILCNHQIFSINKSPSYTFISSRKCNEEDIHNFLKEYDILSSEFKIKDSFNFSWPQGLPVYSHELSKVWEEMDHSPYAYFGNYTHAISLRKLVESF